MSRFPQETGACSVAADYIWAQGLPARPGALEEARMACVTSANAFDCEAWITNPTLICGRGTSSGCIPGGRHGEGFSDSGDCGTYE